MSDYYLDQPSRPIELNPAHKGRFTEWCLRHGFRNVQEGARHVLANRERYPADVVKMANFAHESKKWNKGDRHPQHSRRDDHIMDGNDDNEYSDREDRADEMDPNEEDDRA